jgi:hypothetical protein
LLKPHPDILQVFKHKTTPILSGTDPVGIGVLLCKDKFVSIPEPVATVQGGLSRLSRVCHVLFGIGIRKQIWEK